MRNNVFNGVEYAPDEGEDMQKITEEQKLQEDWYAEARKMTPEKFPEFFRHLMEDFEHDYGTVCHALAAIAVGAANAANRHPGSRGGITGFQSGAVQWEFIRNWSDMGVHHPYILQDLDNLLYPQYDYKFDKTISQETFKHLQEIATKNLAEINEESMVHPHVKERWELIALGSLPEGWSFKED